MYMLNTTKAPARSLSPHKLFQSWFGFWIAELRLAKRNCTKAEKKKQFNRTEFDSTWTNVGRGENTHNVVEDRGWKCKMLCWLWWTGVCEAAEQWVWPPHQLDLVLGLISNSGHKAVDSVKQCFVLRLKTRPSLYYFTLAADTRKYEACLLVTSCTALQIHAVS